VAVRCGGAVALEAEGMEASYGEAKALAEEYVAGGGPA